MTTAPRLVAAERRDDDAADASLRPQRLPNSSARSRRAPTCRSSSRRRARASEALDHVLFVGPPGLGKTTLAQIVARELGVNFRATSGPVIAKAGDLAALLTNLEDARRAVHRRDSPAQSGGRGNPLSGDGGFPARPHHRRGAGGALGEDRSAPSSRWSAPRRAPGLLTKPLRDRFGIPVRLNFYTEAELEQIVKRGARVLGIGMTRRWRQRDRAARARHAAHRRAAAAPRARFRRCRRRRSDRSQDRRQGAARTRSRCRAGSMRWTGAISRLIAENYGGGPVGVETMAAALSEPRDAIEDIIEPFLIQQGFVQRTPRGRLLTAHAFKHLGLAEPARDAGQFGLFGAGRRRVSDKRSRIASPSTAKSSDGRHPCRCASITRTRIFPASSITRAICASWSAAAPIICGCSAPTSARCSSRPKRKRRASPSSCAR